MSTALFAVPGILAPLQSLFRWFAVGTPPKRYTVPPADLRNVGSEGKHNATNSIANYALSTRARGINDTKIRAVAPFRTQPARSVGRPSQVLPHSTLSRASPVLRVMRVLEAGQAPASVGRMVISGRMADVCAELDRLAAREDFLLH